MGIFDSLRKIAGSRQEESSSWNQPQTEGEIDEILKIADKPQVFYKHSYRCSISLFAKRSIESGMDSLLGQVDFHLVDVVANRKASEIIAKKIGVRHESPQIILVQNGEPFWQTSHGGVRIEALRDAISELKNGSH